MHFYLKKTVEPYDTAGAIINGDMSLRLMRLDDPQHGEIFTFIDVCNGSKTQDGVKFLRSQNETTPEVAFMAGDFNIRHKDGTR